MIEMTDEVHNYIDEVSNQNNLEAGEYTVTTGAGDAKSHYLHATEC